MNWLKLPFFLLITHTTVFALRCTDQEFTVPKREVDLSKKVVRMGLNQIEPAPVKVGLQGITTLQFPAKIEAIDGYGFSQEPNPERGQLPTTESRGLVEVQAAG